MKVTANVETYLKKDPTKQASELPDDQKVAIVKGREFDVTLLEQEDEDNGLAHGHSLIEIGYGAGEWWIFNGHWDYESQVIVEEPPKLLPEWDEVNWLDFSAPVSKFFTVGEVCLNQSQRRPRADAGYTEKQIKQNIITVARLLDEIREEWGPIGVNSWLRPSEINRKVGSRSINHVLGSAVDFRCLRGNTVGLENMIEQKWWDTGRWPAGFGTGASSGRGFVHLDLTHQYGRRRWRY